MLKLSVNTHSWNKLWSIQPSPLAQLPLFQCRQAHSSSYYYDVLGITPRATHKQIKAAFYGLSKLHHPDVNDDPETATKFHEITEAYEVLGNHLKRRKYDRGILQDRTKPSSQYDGGKSETSFRPGAFKSRGPIKTGRTKYYNFDEYYKQHYGEQVLQQFKKRERNASKARRESTRTGVGEESIQKELHQFVRGQANPFEIFMVFFGLTALLFAFVFMESDFVRELERPPDRKSKDSK